MQILFISREHGATRSLHMSPRRLIVLTGLTLLLALVSGVWVGNNMQQPLASVLAQVVGTQSEHTGIKPQELLEAKADAQRQLDALSVHMGELQARISRLDALGERLAELAGLDNGEFDFSLQVGQGGPEELLEGESLSSGDIMASLDELLARVDYRERQLGALEDLMAEQELSQAQMLSGWPVNTGYLSSTFGRRSDPFHGRASMHKGVDFAARTGSEIKAVAAGVVTWSGRRGGYGWTVEVSHADGYTTLYAHNSRNLVEVGDLVQRGQVIALVGSTGRSTGSHLHFEVKKNGQQVNPQAYLSRTDSEG